VAEPGFGVAAFVLCFITKSLGLSRHSLPTKGQREADLEYSLARTLPISNFNNALRRRTKRLSGEASTYTYCSQSVCHIR
jgi:hypothetical protein